jgi:hypothetical protein
MPRYRRCFVPPTDYQHLCQQDRVFVISFIERDRYERCLIMSFAFILSSKRLKAHHFVEQSTRINLSNERSYVSSLETIFMIRIVSMILSSPYIAMSLEHIFTKIHFSPSSLNKKMNFFQHS